MKTKLIYMFLQVKWRLNMTKIHFDVNTVSLDTDYIRLETVALCSMAQVFQEVENLASMPSTVRALHES